MLTFSGVVSNSGNITLTNVTVINNQPTNNAPVFGPVTLMPGQATNFTGSYIVPLDSCGPYADTLTARANSICGGSNVVNTAMASCPGTNTPALVVTKACPASPVPPGQPLTFSGTVSNSGNITLTNIVVVNNQPSNNAPVFTVAALAPGQVTNFTGSYTVPLDSCGPYPDTLTARGQDKCFGRFTTNTAMASCPGTNTAALVVTKACPVTPVQPGQSLIFSGTVSNSGNITLTNIVVVNNQPTNNAPVFTVAALAPGQVTNFTGSYTVPLDSCGPYADTLTAFGQDKCFGRFTTNTAMASCPGTNTPAVVVTKTCPPSPVPPGQLLVFSGTVSNSGNITLTNIVVVNNQPTNNAPVFTVATLAPGQMTNFTGSYTVPLDSCGPYFDMLTVTANDKCFGRSIANTGSASCPGTNTPALVVTKACPVTSVQPGQTLVFSGTVSNSGNITLTNIVVVNNQPTNNAPVFTVAALAPGQVSSFTGSYTVPVDSCGPYPDTLTARGQDKCFGRFTTNIAMASCPGTNTAAVVVTKTCPASPVQPGQTLLFSGTVSNSGNITLTNIVVVNSQPTNNAPVFTVAALAPGQVTNFTGSYTVPLDSCGPYLDTLTVSANDKCFGRAITNTATASCAGTNAPALVVMKSCPAAPVAPGQALLYMGVVSNAGNITLTNVLVFNSQPTNNTPVLGPVTLAPGQLAMFTASYAVPADSCGPYADTLTARGQDKCFGRAVTNTGSASCPGTNSPAIVVTKACPATPVQPGQSLVFSGTVSNAGNITLTNVIVVNSQPSNNAPVFAVASLAPGQVTNFTGSYTVPLDSCGPYADTLIVTANDKCFGRAVTNIASASCPGTNTAVVIVTKTCPAAPVAPGQSLVFSGTVSNAGNITLTNIVVVNNQPTNNAPVFTVATLAPGQVTNFTGSYTVPSDSCGPYADTLTARAQDKCFGRFVTHTAGASCAGTNSPALIVTKRCPEVAVFSGQPLTFTGTVSNSGNITLTNVVVRNDQPAPNTVVFAAAALAPGQAASFTGTYTAPLNACSIADTLTATANDKCFGRAVTNASGATCPIITTAGIVVTKRCPTNAVSPGQPFTFSGTVSNSGNVTLTNVTIVDDQPVPGTFVTNFASLLPGQAFNFSGTYTAPQSCVATNTLTATARSICASNVTSMATAICPLTTTIAATGPANVSVAAGVNVTLCTVASGNGPFTYQWFRGGSVTPIAGQTSNCLTLTNVTGASTGLYCVKVTGLCDSVTNCATVEVLAVLGDFVWHDLNRNGRQDGGEPGLSNVVVQLTDCVGTPLRTTNTDVNGLYLFANLLPGQYKVTFGQPAGFMFTLPNVGSDDLDSDANPTNGMSHCVTLVAGETNRTVDAGLFKPAAIGDFVWHDLNTNGVQNIGEPGISNVTVQLMDCLGNVVRTTNTDVNGLYLFAGLIPGDYKITFISPAGYFFTTPNAGNDEFDSDANVTNGMSPCVTLTSGVTNRTVDAGLYQKGAIGDFVWHDLNHNGVQDLGEPGVSNAPVQLMNCTGTVLKVGVTGPDGKYLFDCLTAGVYKVTFTPPPGYMFTLTNAGPDDVDSDADPITGMSQCVTLPPGQTNRTVDAGVFIPAALGDFVWHDLNKNGRQDLGEPGVPNVVVRLTDCLGSLLQSTNTDVNGLYLFANLLPGGYKVTFVAPSGFVFTTPNIGTDDRDSDADPVTGMSPCVTLISGEINLTVDAGLVAIPPCIRVVKEIACMLPDDDCGPFGKTATGFKGDNQIPAFCYSITVSNCGLVALTNVMVLDNQIGDLTTNYFDTPAQLFPVNGSVTRFFKMSWDVDTTNTVIAMGQSAATGESTNSVDSAVALVEEASIICRTITFSPDDQDGNLFDLHVELPRDGQDHAVTFFVVVCNDGQSDLANVRISAPALAAFGCTNPAPFQLAAGACVTNALCTVMLNCNDSLGVPFTNLVQVTAQVDTSTNACGYDAAGSNIVVRSSCEAFAECGSGACRVTGGGKQLKQYTSSLDAAFDVRYVTHGGQVGAPVGTATAFDPDSPCIHGRWTHVRHAKGGLRGNFHGRSFDSLMCACLGCPENPGTGVVIGGRCNPDDRVCGPEPRKAPANKICFSGVGDYVLTSGRRTPRSVLFRVDIEDRSEPGGSHPGGGTAPPDRYRLRIWILTAAELARLNNSSDRFIDVDNNLPANQRLSRRAIACSAATTIQQDGAAVGGAAVPLGTAVFGVRPPDIDDGGELQHGNHQIHPMIKDCP